MQDQLLRLGGYIEALAVRFEAADLFYGHGTDNSWDEAVYLTFAALGLSFEADDSIMSRLLSVVELSRLEELVQRRIKERLPVAYLVGEAWFAGLPFRVDQRVLIPRSPIGELIGTGFAGLLPHAPERILDLCTGSGCIGIACALTFSEARVDLADISADALELAQVNIARHELQNRVEAIKSDLFSALSGEYDLVITNPPYVSREEIDELPPEYGHEPELGLLSAAEGLAIPLRILSAAASYLSPDGILIMEVGYSRDALCKRLPQVPFLWLEFDSGGEGVCMLTARQLREWQGFFT
jgi:ribosomal protein L3 glutamine methyltransferase